MIGGPVARLEPRDHLVAALLRGAAVQERDVGVEAGRQVRHEQVPELGELGEAQHPVALGQDLGEDLLQADDLAGAPADRRSRRAAAGPGGCRPA